MKFTSRNPQYQYLRNKWINRHKHTTQNLLDKHFRHIAMTSLGGLLLLPSSGLTFHPAKIADQTAGILAAADTNKLLAAELKGLVPLDNSNLSPIEEKQIVELLSRRIGIAVAAEVDGKRLNRTYGLIGGEQHLYRYPGDSLYDHARDARDWALYSDAGMAPGLGAWGYFAPSKETFTKEDADRERYYIAVQTFLSPGFAEHVAEYRDFYKYRKMLVVNPQTGQAIVADIADAGPSEYTGKNLGGSPEVMDALGLGSGPRKGGVLYFFLKDQSTPLGPVKIPEGES